MSSPKTFFTTKKSLGEKSNKILLCQWIKFDFSSVVGGGWLPEGVCVVGGMRGPDVTQRTKWIILHAHLKNNTLSLFQIRANKILFEIHSVYFLLKYKIMLDYYSSKLQWEFKSMFTSLVLLDGIFYFNTAQYIVTAVPCLRVYKQRLRGQDHTRFVLNSNAVVFYKKVQTCKRCV